MTCQILHSHSKEHIKKAVESTAVNIIKQFLKGRKGELVHLMKGSTETYGDGTRIYHFMVMVVLPSYLEQRSKGLTQQF